MDLAMGHVYADVSIADPRKTRIKNLKMLVDTGATHTLVNQSLAKELGLQILGESYVTLADGTRKEAGVSLAFIEINGRSEIVRIRVFDVDEPVIGVSTLEDLGLCVDPVSGKLTPTRSFTARA